MTHFRRMALLAAAAVVAACSDDTAEPRLDDIDVTDDVAQMTADAALVDLETMAAASTAAGDPRRGMGPGGGDPAVDGRFPPGAVFYDADGLEMDAFDPLLTEAVSWTFSREVTLDRGSVTGEISRTRALTVSGLLGEETERVHDGSGSDQRSRVVIDAADGTRTYDFSSQVSIEGVVHAVDREALPWPLSGTITRQVRVTVVNGLNGDIDETHTSVLTFDGTRYATLVVDGETFEVDLAERGGRAAERAGPGGPGARGGPNG